MIDIIVPFVLCTVVYFIGVFIGKQSVNKDTQIEHVGYDAEQMGREK